MFRFLNAADLHVDSPLLELASKSADFARSGVPDIRLRPTDRRASRHPSAMRSATSRILRRASASGTSRNSQDSRVSLRDLSRLPPLEFPLQDAGCGRGPGSGQASLKGGSGERPRTEIHGSSDDHPCSNQEWGRSILNRSCETRERWREQYPGVGTIPASLTLTAICVFRPATRTGTVIGDADRQYGSVPAFHQPE
jgi:hypothetical protein